MLVIDDDEVVTQTFRRMLQLEGFDVRTVTNAADGLEQVSERRPDAILLDLRMPLIDGLEFLRRLRSRESERPTPVAIVTGDYLLDDTVIQVAQSLNAVIRFKPMWLEDLVLVVQELAATSVVRRDEQLTASATA